MTKGNRKPGKGMNSALLFGVILTSVLYIGWRIFFTIPLHYGMLSFLCGIALCAAEAVGVLEAFANYRNLHSFDLPEKPDIPDEMYPHIDVLIATHNEEIELLYKTINACTFLTYPDKDKVHVYLCDDTARQETKELADRLKIGWIGMSGNKDAKAGNLNNALSQTHSPLVATFDADMIPTSDFLMETVPYFFLPKMVKENGRWRARGPKEIDTKYKIGFVQTPQSFYNADMFQFNLYTEKNVPNEQDYFFREVNIGRNRTNSAIYAGSNTVIAREALDRIGGIRTGTITEDFATGMDIQAAGYTTYAIKKTVAHGLAPNDLMGLIRQRQRWGRGCIQVLRSKRFLFSKLHLKAKLDYVMCGLYWWTFFRRFVFIMSPILFIVFGIVVVDCSLWELLFIWLPSYVIYNRAQNLMSGKIRNVRLSNLIDTIMFPHLIFPVVFETLGIRMKRFFVTPKAKTRHKNASLKYAVPHLILTVFSVTGLVFCIHGMIRHHYGNVIILYWLCVNLYTLVNAVVFYVGRVNFRHSERFYARVPVTIQVDLTEIHGETTDLSEGGMAVLLPESAPLPHVDRFFVHLHDKDYHAAVPVEVLNAVRENGRWKVSLRMIECTEDNRRQYLQIVFDRNHTLPTVISSTLLRDAATTICGIMSAQKRGRRVSGDQKQRDYLHTKANQSDEQEAETEESRFS